MILCSEDYVTLTARYRVNCAGWYLEVDRLVEGCSGKGSYLLQYSGSVESWSVAWVQYQMSQAQVLAPLLMTLSPWGSYLTPPCHNFSTVKWIIMALISLGCGVIKSLSMCGVLTAVDTTRAQPRSLVHMVVVIISKLPSIYWADRKSSMHGNYHCHHQLYLYSKLFIQFKSHIINLPLLSTLATPLSL